MAFFIFLPAIFLLSLLIRIAIAAWLTRPDSKRDPDKFLRVYNGLRGFDSLLQLVESWNARRQDSDTSATLGDDTGNPGLPDRASGV